ncbi:MAG TPA: PilN domain-containing protein [Gammaproteobacteria bacterium]
MGQINLLPWREERRKEKTAEFATLAGIVALFAIVIVFAARFHIGNIEEYHKSRNAYLQTQIDILNTKLQEIQNLEETKANLLARMNVIQELQRSRPEIVHLFDEIVTTIPEGVWLNDIKQTEKTLKIEGKAESNARVSAYMRNLEASAWLKNPVLEVIEADKATRIAKFKLSLQQESMIAEAEEEPVEPKASAKGGKAKGKTKGKAEPKAGKEKAKPKAKGEKKSG